MRDILDVLCTHKQANGATSVGTHISRQIWKLPKNWMHSKHINWQLTRDASMYSAVLCLAQNFDVNILSPKLCLL